MKKLSSLLLLSTLFIGATSFGATHYEGNGAETEFGVQTCSMVVEEIGNGFEVTLRALATDIKTFVVDGDQVNFKVEQESDAKFVVDGKKQTGTLKISASGRLNKGKPVSFKMTVKTSDGFLGRTTETVNCKF